MEHVQTVIKKKGFRIRGDAYLSFKQLDNSWDLSDHFINQLIGYISFLETHDNYFGLREIVNLLWLISSGLYKIHELGLVNGNLHGGWMLDARSTDKERSKQTQASDIYSFDQTRWVAAICDDPEPSDV
ncbi:kinase-like domain-containing protein [Rhizophagus irregularis DAOM 181602=DAOM 197198]|nr:kinase-like domain-containing protein [Rhizophagus irregularis DAOM 181602=DAOM 197198]